MQMKAVQFIGTQRSGSNLLRVMLNEHSKISSPHPPHILQVMMPFLPIYGSLANDNNFKILVEDVCHLVETNPVNWGLNFDRNQIATNCSNRNLVQIMKAIYEAKANLKGASVWCCKSMASIHYIKEIEDSGIEPFYIFIFRDGRDVACSFRKAVVGEKHLYQLAQQWKTEQDLSIALCERVGPSRSISVRYENLIVDAEKELKRICEALKIEFEPSMLNYASAEESKVTASSGQMWGNLVKPVMKDNTKKYLKELTSAEIEIFESVAGSTLEALGYERETPANFRLEFSARDIDSFKNENAALQAEAKAGAIEDMQKRKKQDEFIATLKKRFHDFNATQNAHA